MLEFKKSIPWLLTIILLICAGCQPQDLSTSPPPEATKPPSEATEPPLEPTLQPEVPTEVPVTGEGPLYGGTLVVPRWPEVPTCNPGVSSQIDYVRNVFDMLTRFNANYDIIPQLAESWEVGEDNLQVIFKLREDVRWHDGVPFTSADVKFTFENILMVYHPRGKVAFAVIDAIETPDDYTVVFKLNQPTVSRFFYQLSTESNIMPKHIYENEDVLEGPHATCDELPIGTGPFIATEYVRGSFLTMVRNNDYWGKNDYWGGPYVDTIIEVFIPDAVARVNGLIKGDFHYVGDQMLPISEAHVFEAMDGREVLYDCMGPHDQTNFSINLRDENAPWADVRVRQAISWALDRTQINERVFYNTGVPSNMFIPPSHPLYNPAIADVYMQQDIARAEALLDEAGYPRNADGIRFEVRVVYDTRVKKVDLAAVMEQQLAEVGIKVIHEAGEYNYWTDKTYMTHDFDISLTPLGVFELSVGAARLHRSDNIGEALFNNSSAYVNPEIDELWDTYATSFDPEVRRNSLYRIQEILIEDVPYVYLNNTIEPAAVDTEEFAGWPSDCIIAFDMFRTVWWKGGSPTP
jgi:peptide/nickel transport system substrate-binding protein